MKYALFVIFEKAAKLEIVACCKKIGGTLRVKSADCFACWVIVYAFYVVC